MDEKLKVVNNKKNFRFEIHFENGESAILEYRWLKGSMVLMRTLVPENMRGKGIGGALVKYVLEHARKHHLKVIVYCPFVSKYIQDHPEYADLVDSVHKK